MRLEVADVHASYGSSKVLHGLSLHLAEGEVLGLLGRNGRGKTTLVHTIAGLMKPRAGSITLDGHPIAGLPAERVARHGVALVPQGRRVFRSLTVGEHLDIAARDPGGDGWSIAAVCERFPILAQRWNQMAGQLSGGQQQMLAIGRALVANARLVLMDEPAEGLDPGRMATVADVVRDLRARGTGVLVVEQKVGFALEVVDRVEVIERGRTTFATTPQEVGADRRQLYHELGFG